MNVQSLHELQSAIRSGGPGFQLPLALFGNPATPHGGFDTLADAADWYLLNGTKVDGSVDNSDIAYLRANFGWVIGCVEINCWGVLDRLSQLGVSEVVDKAAYASRATGGYAARLRTRLSELVPSGAQTIVHWDEITNSDFYSLSQALGYVARNPPAPSQYLSFCETPTGRWLVLCSISPKQAEFVRALLAVEGTRALDYIQARASVSSPYHT